MTLVFAVEYISLALIAYGVKNSKSQWVLWIFTALLFSVTMALIEPSPAMDLYRYYQMLDEYRIGGWDYTVSQYYFRLSPLYPIYYYLISRLQNNAWLIAVTTFLDATLLFWILGKAKRKYKMTDASTVIAFYCVLLFLDLLNVTGIRSMLATVLATVALYLDFAEKEKKAIVFYILAALLHSSVIPVIICRIALVLFRKVLTSQWVIIAFILVTFAGLDPIAQFVLELYSITGYHFFYALGYQIIGYTENTSMLGITHTVYVSMTAIRAACLYLEYKHSARDIDCDIFSMLIIPLYIEAFAMGNIRYSVVAIRYAIMGNVLLLPVLWHKFSKIRVRDNKSATTIQTQALQPTTVVILLTCAFQLFYLFYYQYSQF